MKKQLYNNLNYVVKGVLINTKGWLVGRAPKDIIEGFNPSDYDIIVPNRSLFNSVVRLLASQYDFKLNNYGGFKFILDEKMSVDIWCEELSHFLLTANEVTYAFNMKRNQLLKII